MKKQLNVQQQNAETKSAIQKSASHYVTKHHYAKWVREALEVLKLSPLDGILVKLTVIPDQAGQCAHAIWLTDDHQFYTIDAMIAYETWDLLEVETFENITSEIVVSSHQRGTGKSFGTIALEVLDELRNG